MGEADAMNLNTILSRLHVLYQEALLFRLAEMGAEARKNGDIEDARRLDDLWVTIERIVDGSNGVTYAIVHDQAPPFTVYSEVMTSFGSKPARNFVKECETYEEAEALVKRLSQD